MDWLYNLYKVAYSDIKLPTRVEDQHGSRRPLAVLLDSADVDTCQILTFELGSHGRAGNLGWTCSSLGTSSELLVCWTRASA